MRILNLYREVCREINQYYDSHPEDAINDILKTIPSTKAIYRNLMVLSAGGIVIIVSFIGNLYTSEPPNFVMISSLRYPLIILIVSLLFVYLADTLLNWFLGGDFLKGSSGKYVRGLYYTISGVLSWLATVGVFLSFGILIWVITSIGGQGGEAPLDAAGVIPAKTGIHENALAAGEVFSPLPQAWLPASLCS